MARARIELRGALTHQAPAGAGGRLLKKGSPVIVTNPSHIDYYKSQSGFAVTLLKDKAKVAAKPAPEPETSDDGEGEGDSGYSEAALKKMKKPQLQEIAADLELETEGATVAELIDGILEAQAEADGADEE